MVEPMKYTFPINRRMLMPATLEDALEMIARQRETPNRFNVMVSQSLMEDICNRIKALEDRP